ncbi:amidohydrolase [Thorsellia anophelis]|uniref:Amidohydrolase n=1 Tax=Thorsellia anophelis DSM 18579 TaxID=1123402 RepID=A0A1I0BJC6_9GAMM|nr:amidohydrolase [Thorsellia anophelis]SET07045.1 amidohydrolase [Thorsellia anophelis DSM 18579]
MNPTITSLIKASESDISRWRRHIHANPELSFQEFETAKYIFNELSQYKELEISQPTPNSVVARLQGNQPGKCIALRADIDALPLQEESGESFQSTKPNIMHACGHDAHTAMLMGAAKVLSTMKDVIKGEVVFIFQHAEEVPPGGAQELIEIGILDNVDMIFGLHVWPGAPVGTVVIKPGVFCASTDNFDIKIQGKGGHGSMPHLTIDSVLVAANIVTNLQSIIARRLDPIYAPVLTIAKLQAGNSYNVIPDTAHLAGTLRTHSKAVRESVPTLIQQTIEGICHAYGAKFEIEWTKGYTVGINNAEACQIANDMIHEYLPDLKITTFEHPNFGGEDFSAYLEKVPGAFMMIGVGDSADYYNVHHPKFKINEAALTVGTSIHVGLIIKLLT